MELKNNNNLKYINKVCLITFRHILIDGTEMTRNMRFYITENNLDILDDKRIVNITILKE